MNTSQQPSLHIEPLGRVLPATVYAELPKVIALYGINTSLRLAHFLSQSAHESSGFTKKIENLNYSAQGLANTWPGRYAINPKAALKTPNDIANNIQRNAEAIANNTYANRNGNGPVTSGDGWRYRGRGYIQLTGRSNYTAFTKSIGEDCVTNPDLVAVNYPLVSAAWFFSSNGLNSVADAGDTMNTVMRLTKLINGGTTGLDDRAKKFNEYYNLIK